MRILGKRKLAMMRCKEQRCRFGTYLTGASCVHECSLFTEAVPIAPWRVALVGAS